MSILDGLTETEIFESTTHGSMLISEIAKDLFKGTIAEGSDYVLTTAAALNLARFYAKQNSVVPGTPQLTESDLLPAPGNVRLIRNDGKVFMGTGAAIDDTLAKVQTALMTLIDQETLNRIVNGPGFEYAGKHFSCSMYAQTKWLGLFTGRALITYPYLIPTKDNLGYYEITNADTVATMYGLIMDLVASELRDSCEAKQAIWEATTIVEARSAANAYLNPE